jgi:acyl carrier protein
MNTEEINKASIQKTVIDTVAEVLDVDVTELSSETKLQDDLGADSIDFVEVLMILEDAYDTEFPDNDVRDTMFITIDDITTFVYNHLKK